MKKLLLLGLLTCGLAIQTASAAVRTFEYTATVDSFVYNNSFPHQSVPGAVDGSTVSVGDTFTGWFSFDDAGNDWTKPDYYSDPAISVGVKFADGVSVVTADPTWFLQPSSNSLSFGIGGTSAQGVFLNTVISNRLPFSWDVSVGSGNVTMSWARPGVNVWLYADVSELKEIGVSPVPEPSTYAMLLLGAAVAAGAARRRTSGQARRA